MGAEKAWKKIERNEPAEDLDVRYWQEQFRKNSLSGVTATDKFQIMISVTKCLEKTIAKEERIKKLSITLGVSTIRALEIIKVWEEQNERKGI